MNYTTTFATSLLAAMAAVGSAQYSAIALQPATDGQGNSVVASQGLGASATHQGGYTHDVSGLFRAAMWSGTKGSFVDLHPSGFISSTVQDVNGHSQVGNGELVGGIRNALVWFDTAASAVNLHPAGFDWSQAWGVGGGNQVGFGQITGGDIHALLWSGTASSMVDLHPAGYRTSYAYGTSATQQVGEGAVFSRPSPLLWSGTAASVVNLQPAGYLGGGAYTTDGSSQGGYVIAAGPVRQAALWKGSAASFSNLHPAGLVNSHVWDVEGKWQTGYGRDSLGVQHAIVWKGTAASAVDLNQFLPTGYHEAYAFGVDNRGNVTGHAMNEATGEWNAFYWAKKPTVSGIQPANLNGGSFHSAFQIRFKLLDDDGAYIDNEVVTTKLEKLGTPDTLIDPNVYSNQGDTFTFNGATHIYTFHFKVSGLSAGTYRLTLTFSNGATQVYTFTRA